MNPEFSIIIPVYNIENYITRCMESVLNQDFTDYEAILVDDGSKDKSTEICDYYAAKYPQIKVVHKKNGGLSDARNAGMEVAIGKYFYFLDGDDYIAPDLLGTVYEELKDKEKCMIVFPYKIVSERDEVKDQVGFEERTYPLHTDQLKLDYIVNVLVQYKQGWEAWDRVYDGRIIRENNLWFYDNDKIFAEDLLFMMTYLQYIDSIKGIGKALYYYVTRDDSIMAVKSKRFNLQAISKLLKVFSDSILPKYHYIESNKYIYSTMLLYGEAQKCKDMNIDADLQLLKEDTEVYEQIKRFCKNYRQIAKTYIGDYAEKIARYFGEQYKLRIKKRYSVQTRVKNKIKRTLRPYVIYRSKKRNIFIIGSEDTGNLGDHQIAESMKDFFRDKFPDCGLFEISMLTYSEQIEEVQRYCRKKDLICLPGGGNIGNIYPVAEFIRRDVIKRFPQNKIVIFPQTIHFEDSENGKRERELTGCIYGTHRNLIVSTRDKKSFDLAKEMFPQNKVLFVPDIVMYTNKASEEKRKGVVLCLRNDVEGILGTEGKEVIINTLSSLGLSYEFIDHQYDFNIPLSEREEYLQELFSIYKNAGLIITDRLHGMIFAAITGTPCIAFDNYNGKVAGVYEWIKPLEHIKLCKDREDVGRLIELLYVEGTYCGKLPNQMLQEEFNQLLKELE